MNSTTVFSNFDEQSRDRVAGMMSNLGGRRTFQRARVFSRKMAAVTLSRPSPIALRRHSPQLWRSP
jgi:hypothetical protein